MTKAKDLEVNNVVKIVEETIYQMNIWYPYTIRKVLCSKLCQEYLKNDINIKIEKIIYVIENVCHWLKGKPHVKLLNLSSVIDVVLIENDEILKKIIYCVEKNEIDIEKNGLDKVLDIELKKIDFKLLNSRIYEDSLIISKSASSEEIDFKNTEELEKIILNLINSNNLSYSDLLTKFFIELDLEYFFKFRNDYKIKRIKRNENGLITILNYLNVLIYKLDEVFERDNLFLIRMLEIYLFPKTQLKDYFIQCLMLDDDDFEKKINHISEKNFGIILRGFEDGLLRMKNYYLVEFSNYNNSVFGNFRGTTRSYQHDCVKKFFAELENQSIYTVYNISHIKDSEVGQYQNQMKSLINDIIQKRKDISVTKQEITEEQKELILAIMERLDKNQNIFKDIALHNLNQTGRDINILSFKLCVENNNFEIKISKHNKDLIWYATDNGKKIIRELCVCAEDVERVLQLINRYIKEKELVKKYQLT